MNIDTINPYVIKILISARNKDSISSISKRIGLSYGWTHRWVRELIKEGIFKEKWKGVILQEKNKSYRQILKFIRNNLNETRLYYSVLNLFGIEYCFTQTDAVYYSPQKEGKFKFVKHGEYFMEPLDETISFMSKNIYNFEPALEIVNEIYKKGLNFKYKEINTL